MKKLFKTIFYASAFLATMPLSAMDKKEQNDWLKKEIAKNNKESFFGTLKRIGLAGVDQEPFLREILLFLGPLEIGQLLREISFKNKLYPYFIKIIKNQLLPKYFGVHPEKDSESKLMLDDLCKIEHEDHFALMIFLSIVCYGDDSRFETCKTFKELSDEAKGQAFIGALALAYKSKKTKVFNLLLKQVETYKPQIKKCFSSIIEKSCVPEGRYGYKKPEKYYLMPINKFLFLAKQITGNETFEEITRYLVETKITEFDNKQKTPGQCLHLMFIDAATDDYPEVLRFLLENFREKVINAIDIRNFEALREACKNQSFECVKIICSDEDLFSLFIVRYLELAIKNPLYWKRKPGTKGDLLAGYYRGDELVKYLIEKIAEHAYERRIMLDDDTLQTAYNKKRKIFELIAKELWFHIPRSSNWRRAAEKFKQLR